MKLISRKMFFAAAAVTLAAAAGGVILVDQDGDADMEKKLEVAGVYLANSDYDNAIAIYNGIIAEDDGCSSAYIGLAEAYYAKDKTEKSLEILERGLECSDDEDAVIKKLAELFPGNLTEDMLSGEDEYSAEEYTDTEIKTETETAVETIVTETETSSTEETGITETETVTAAPETATAVSTTAAPVTTTTAARTTVTTVTTTTTFAAATTTTAAPETTATAEPEPQSVVVEDLIMMTASEARKWCEENNLTLSVIGDGGLIVSQSPAPGSVVFENSEIIVRCE